MQLPLPNLGLIHRALRETLWTTLSLSGVLFAIAALLAFALPRVQARFMQRQFIPPAVREFRNAVLGIDSTNGSVGDIAFSIALIHPIIIALLAAHAIIVCTRILAAEVERGTVDVLLALPISRLTLFVNETAAWLLTACIILFSIYAGCYVGSRFIVPEYRPNFTNMLLVISNLALVYSVIGTSGLLAGVTTDIRVRAVLFVIIITVFSVLINFVYTLDPSLEFTKRLQFLSVLDYYKPSAMLSKGTIPWRDFGILAGISTTLWTLAAIRLVRRDVTTL